MSIDVLIEVKTILDRHRKKAMVTCESTCMCWPVENLILYMEQSAPQQPADAGAGDALCLHCVRPQSAHTKLGYCYPGQPSVFHPSVQE